MKNFEKINDTMILEAKKTNLVNFLRERHPDSIWFASHPNAKKYHCWRSKKHDSLVFFTETDSMGNTIYKYHRWSNREQDDGITYLVKYEGYTWPAAVRALAYYFDNLDS